MIGKAKRKTQNAKLNDRFSSGFTLIEIMVAVLLIGLMSGGGIAAYRRLNERSSVEGAARQVEQALREAQKRAASGVKPSGCTGDLLTYIMTMGGSVVGENKYTIQADCFTSDPYPVTYKLPEGTKFPAQTSISFRALSKGSSGGSVSVQNDTGSFVYEIRVSEGGAITTLRSP